MGAATVGEEGQCLTLPHCCGRPSLVNAGHEVCVCGGASCLTVYSRWSSWAIRVRMRGGIGGEGSMHQQLEIWLGEHVWSARGHMFGS